MYIYMYPIIFVLGYIFKFITVLILIFKFTCICAAAEKTTSFLAFESLLSFKIVRDRRALMLTVLLWRRNGSAI